MESITNKIKKEQWFKIGKWKEPVFLQDIIVRSYIEGKATGVLPFYPKNYFVSDFKQFLTTKEYRTIKKKIYHALVSDPQSNSDLIVKEVERAINSTDRFKPTILTRKKVLEYVELIKIHGQQSFRFIVMGYALEELYPTLLPKAFNLGKKKFTPQSLLALTALPKKVVPMIAERESLLHIAIKLKNKKEVIGDLKKHVVHFSWMNSICWWDEPFSVEHYKNLAIQLSKQNPAKELRVLSELRKQQHDKATAILKELKKIYPGAWRYIDLIRTMADLREESWDAASRAGVRLRPLFKKLAARHHLSYNQAMMLDISEMASLAEGILKVDLIEINQRIKSFSIYAIGRHARKPIIYSGLFSKKLSIAVEGKSKSINSLTGLTIWPGVVRGTVRVLQSPDEVGKMKEGEILICPMTDPDYMPAIHRAKAIVTDQGGVLCHAAIIARELQKVCIVGTHVATKNLR
ncbi:MAG: hypothetical protein KBD83_09605, partial [Gammaproteobacteria bacterium]|nr:hypothetical protein [Gammaproteobacteria bacterium]